VEGAAVLDVFAGTGALGLEALSRGAATACFIESDAAALKALRANIAACKAEDRTRVLAVDVLRISGVTVGQGVGKTIGRQGAKGGLVFLDPPYGQDLVPGAIARLQQTGHITPGALIIAETGCDDPWVPDQPLMVERRHGSGRVLVFRIPRLAPERHPS
jgi:16S rRNA (guanine966-N2)-methyltransferase